MFVLSVDTPKKVEPEPIAPKPVEQKPVDQAPPAEKPAAPSQDTTPAPVQVQDPSPPVDTSPSPPAQEPSDSTSVDDINFTLSQAQADCYWTNYPIQAKAFIDIGLALNVETATYSYTDYKSKGDVRDIECASSTMIILL